MIQNTAASSAVLNYVTASPLGDSNVLVCPSLCLVNIIVKLNFSLFLQMFVGI